LFVCGRLLRAAGVPVVLVMAGPSVGSLSEKRELRDGVTVWQKGMDAGGTTYYLQSLSDNAAIPSVVEREGGGLRLGKLELVPGPEGLGVVRGE